MYKVHQVLAGAVIHCCLIFGVNGQESDTKTLSPYFYVQNQNSSSDCFPLKNTDVKVSIAGIIADVTVMQEYKNEGTVPINAQYFFPASTRAAVHGMQMKIGEEIVVAKIKEKEEAQKQFEEAKQTGKSASLLQQQRPNVFSMDIANIMPGDLITVELHYTEHLIPTDGVYEFVYPTVILPRYSNKAESDASRNDHFTKNPYLKKGSNSGTGFNITVDVSSPLPIHDLSCSSHDVTTKWHDTHYASTTLKNSEEFGGNRDYILHYRLTDRQVSSGLMLYEKGNEKYFMFMAQPPQRVSINDIPDREYIFVVDVSGSMNGFPLETSKKLLRELIGKLRSEELFNVILFAGSSEKLSSSSLIASKDNVKSAIEFIDKQDGSGGTELLPAMKDALSLPASDNYSRSIIIITDGGIAIEKEVFNLIEENLGKTNVFSFGIGASVNRYLIEGIARAGHGEPFIVTEPGEAPEIGDKFRDYINSPVLTNIKVDYNGFNTYDIEPLSIPDMFANRPLVIFGKYRGNAEGKISVSGVSGSGEYINTCNISECKSLESNSGLRYLWARQRIARLSDYNLVISDENKTEVISLGLKYNLLTDYTSFIAVSENVRNYTGNAQDIQQPLSLPKYVSNLAVGGSMQKAAEPEIIVMIFAALFIGCLTQLKRLRVNRSNVR